MIKKSDNRKKRILIIDDDINIYELLKRFLGEAYDVDYAETVAEGIEITKSVFPHLVFLDINLEGDVGFSYLQWKSMQTGACKAVKVIMISSDSITKNIQKAIDLGADDFIVKPLVNKIVLSKTRKAFLNAEFHIRTINEQEDKSAIACLKVKILGRSDVAISVEAPILLPEEQKVAAGQKTYTRRGSVSRNTSGNNVMTLFEVGEDRNSTQSFSDQRTYTIEEKLSGSSINIYVFDDDESENILLVKAFKKLSVEVSCFSSIEDLKKAVVGKLPDLCILDLPTNSKDDSLQLVERLSTDIDAPILVVSSTLDHLTLTRALELGASDYLLKPIKRNYLLEKIAALVFKDAEKVYMKPLVVPTHIVLELEISIQQFDEVGVLFHSKMFFSRGAKLELKSLLVQVENLSIRVTKIERMSDEVNYEVYGEYIDLSDDDMAIILGR